LLTHSGAEEGMEYGSNGQHNDPSYHHGGRGGGLVSASSRSIDPPVDDADDDDGVDGMGISPTSYVSVPTVTVHPHTAAVRPVSR